MDDPGSGPDGIGMDLSRAFSDLICTRCLLYAPYIPLVFLIVFLLLSSLAGIALHVWDTTGFFFPLFFADPLPETLNEEPAAGADGEDGHGDLPEAYWEMMMGAVELDASTTVFKAAPEHASGERRLVCAVCIGGVHDGEVVMEVNACSHMFHNLCLDGWIRTKQLQGRPPTCPLCRAKLLAQGGTTSLRMSTGKMSWRRRWLRCSPYFAPQTERRLWYHSLIYNNPSKENKKTRKTSQGKKN